MTAAPETVYTGLRHYLDFPPSRVWTGVPEREHVMRPNVDASKPFDWCLRGAHEFATWVAAAMAFPEWEAWVLPHWASAHKAAQRLLTEGAAYTSLASLGALRSLRRNVPPERILRITRGFLFLATTNPTCSDNWRSGYRRMAVLAFAPSGIGDDGILRNAVRQVTWLNRWRDEVCHRFPFRDCGDGIESWDRQALLAKIAEAA